MVRSRLSEATFLPPHVLESEVLAPKSVLTRRAYDQVELG